MKLPAPPIEASPAKVIAPLAVAAPKILELDKAPEELLPVPDRLNAFARDDPFRSSIPPFTVTSNVPKGPFETLPATPVELAEVLIMPALIDVPPE